MTTTIHAAQAGAGTPEKDKARGANAGLVGEQKTDGSLNFASSVVDRKELSRLRAQLALRGHYAHCTNPKSSPARFIVTCGKWLVEPADQLSLRAFVERIGGAR